jgi:putative transposase
MSQLTSHVPTRQTSFGELLVQSAQKRWLRIRGFKRLAQVIEGVKFQDGIAVVKPEPSTSKNAA